MNCFRRTKIFHCAIAFQKAENCSRLTTYFLKIHSRIVFLHLSLWIFPGSWIPGVHHVFKFLKFHLRFVSHAWSVSGAPRISASGTFFKDDEFFQTRNNFQLQDRFSNTNCFRHATYSTWESRFYGVARWIVPGTRSPRISTSGSFSKMKCSMGHTT